jgi:hypothetical protein
LSVGWWAVFWRDGICFWGGIKPALSFEQSGGSEAQISMGTKKGLPACR